MLQPFDLVRIYSRYEIDSPTVSIEGQVLRPGTYPLSVGMTVADLVRMAGDFNRSAYRDEAGLSSYVVENGQKVLINHSVIAVQKALDGDKSADVKLKPGDVVSIEQLAGWTDIGSSILVSGEVEHPGNYGIEDGERLSSILKRAGGFRATAYPQAAVYERVQVRELAEQTRREMIRRVETAPIEVKQGAQTTQATADLQQSLQQQRTQILVALRNQPPAGRLVINISSDISKWENTPADILVRTGDTIFIPKQPNFIVVTGQVYNPIAISYVPGKDYSWYLRSAGGVTQYGNKKDIYILRADGSVVPTKHDWFGSNPTSVRMRPGDSVFVPEKIYGGSPIFQNILGIAQIATAAAIPIALAGAF